MDLAKTLIRSVARTFYDLQHVLVVDALMVHSALSVDDMYHLTSVQAKDLRKFLGRLREDRLVSVQQRQEVKVNTTRPIHRDYYYINYHLAIDAIKYRILHLTQKVADLYKPSEEKKDYYCPRCKAQYTQLEVLDKAFADGFLCHRCNHPLERDEASVADRAGHERQSKLMLQIDPLLNLLKKIDAEEIPQNDFQTAMSVAIPVQRNESTHPRQLYELVQEDSKPSSRIKSETMLDLDVTIATEAGRKEAEQKARELKAAQEKQNALPSWYTESTIGIKADPSSPTTATGLSASTAGPSGTSSGIKPDPDAGRAEKKPSLADADAVEQYYASLKEEEERRNALPPGSESEDDSDDDEADEDEEEDGFEDVEIGTTPNGKPSAVPTSGAATPMSSASASASASGTVNGSGNGKKRRAEDDDRNGALANGSGTAVGSSSPTKRVKIESSSDRPGVAEGGVKLEPGTDVRVKLEPATAEESDEDEDDEEFEDAL